VKTKTLSNSHQPTDLTTILGMDVLCFWSNSPTMSAFWGFFTCLIAVIGRAIETACIRLSDLSLEPPPEFGVDENRLKQILSVNLLRHKTANDDVQSIAVFLACTSLLQYFYFSLAYHIAMIDGTPSTAFRNTRTRPMPIRKGYNRKFLCSSGIW